MKGYFYTSDGRSGKENKLKEVTVILLTTLYFTWAEKSLKSMKIVLFHKFHSHAPLSIIPKSKLFSDNAVSTLPYYPEVLKA